jgi:hypothetical protein
MTIRSNIFLLSNTQWKPGVCWLCEASVILKFRDTTTGMCVGSCCVESLLAADRVLGWASHSGLRAPTNEESGSMPNH